MISPLCTRTEPIGMPPSASPCCASSMAACMNGSFIVVSLSDDGVAHEPPPVEAERHAGAVALCVNVQVRLGGVAGVADMAEGCSAFDACALARRNAAAA